MAAIDRGKPIGIAALCAAACACSGIALAGETTHPSGLIQSTIVEREHGVVEIYQSARRADGAAAPAQNRMVLRLPPGAKASFSRFTRCRPAEIQAFGPRGCPQGSSVGRGRVQGAYLQDQVAGKLLLFNGPRITGRRTLLVYTQPDLGPAFIVFGRWTGRNLDLQLARISTGYEPEAVLSNFTFLFRKRFLSAPCNEPWSITGFFVTGVVVTSTDAPRCR